MTLLERKRYLDVLDGWLQDAAASHGRLVFVGGEAGVGKASLIDHFCHRMHDRARMLWGACDALSTPRPLSPLHDIASAIGGDLDRLLSTGGSRDQVFRAAMLAFSGGSLPTVVVVEDAHWADEATLDLLRFLGRRVEPVCALVIVTYRDDEVGATHPLRLVMGDLATTKSVRRLSVPPLSEAAIRDLAAGSGVDPARLHRLTGGNPFFATEVLADDAGAGDLIPATIRDAVLARASRLTPEGREALGAAAVIGPPLTSHLLSEIAEATPAAIAACLEGGMLVPTSAQTYAFRHELARTAILEAIPPLRRCDLHARVLAALQTGPATEHDLASLAHHAEAAANGAAVLRFAPAAARAATALHAHREAAAQYARALRWTQDQPPEERAELLEACSYECYLTGQLDKAIVLRREALQIWRASQARLREGDALRWISRCSWYRGHNTDAIEAAEAALAVLEPLPPGPELAMALSNRSQLYMLGGETAPAIQWGEQAMALAETLGETDIYLHALINVGTARLKPGDGQGWAELERALALALAANLEDHIGRVFTNLSWNAVLVHDLPRAAAYFAMGIAYTTDHDLDSCRLYMLSWRGHMRLLAGDWAGAAADASEVVAQPTTARISRIVALTGLGLVRARRGDPGVQEVFSEALTMAEATGETQRLRPVRTARAEAAWLAGDHARAAAEARSVLNLTVRLGSPWDIGEVLIWLARASSPEPIAFPGLADLPAPYRLALTGDWAGAAAAWEALGCPYDAALTLIAGDEPAVRKALAIFDRLGARPAATIAAHRLRALGVRAVPRGPRPSTRANPANLTTRELDLLPLLAAGQRNAEIAAGLFLSPKTVEHHISSILAKLGVRSRAEVAAAAQNLGLPLDQHGQPLSPS